MDDINSKGVVNYRDLVVWQRAMDLVDSVYKCAAGWPASELYGLSSQIKRAVVSVAANIAEGHGRNGRREYVYHLGIARGSLCEVETLILVAARQEFVPESDLERVFGLSTEVGKMLRRLLQSLERTPTL